VDAKTLMDSRRFVALMNGCVSVWKGRRATDEERAAVLQPVLDYLALNGSQAPKKGMPLGPATPFKPAVENLDIAMTPQEEARIAAEVDATPQPDKMDLLRRAIREVIKPNWDKFPAGMDGFKRFNINLRRHGQSVPTSGWQEALKAENVPFVAVEFDVQEIDKGFMAIKIA
jgi:hypothetical protein